MKQHNIAPFYVGLNAFVNKNAKAVTEANYKS